MFGMRKRKRVDPLDRVLWRWKAVDTFSRRDLLRSCCVLGASGSGKSSSFGLHAGVSLVADRKIGGLILASKPEDRQFWERVFAQCDRSEDLLIMDDSARLRFNLLQHELDSGADTRELTQCLMVIAETLNRGQCEGGGDRDPFFRSAGEMMLHFGTEIVTLATGKLDPQVLLEFITGHANLPEEVKSEAWQKGPHNKLLEAAYRNARTPRQKHDFMQAWNYWVKFIPALNDRTRSSIEAGVQNILFSMNNGLAHSLLTGKSNITPAVLNDGYWWLLDLPVSNYGAAGAFVNGAIRLGVQKHILRRHAGPDSPITVLWLDEYQIHVNSFDAKFLAECRSHHGCMIVMTQSLHSFYAEMAAGHKGKAFADALLTNFGHKVFFTLGDDQSAAYASSLCGKTKQTYIGGSSAPQDDLWDDLWGVGKLSGTFSEHIELAVQHREFLQGRCGGKANAYMCDAWVIRSGEPFASNGLNYIRTAFSQR